jgi:hypothetical protein
MGQDDRLALNRPYIRLSSRIGRQAASFSLPALIPQVAVRLHDVNDFITSAGRGWT